jgi:pimeloyl-ACP methyl ester carboxylesterase
MLKLALRIAGGVVLAFLGALALLFAFQSRLIYPAPQEHHAPAPGFRAVRLTTEDGLALTAHWRAPEAEQPTLVYFHGNGGSLAGATEETRLLATQGYGVLLVEYRGYGGNPGEPSEAGFTRDGRAAMAFLAGKRIVPARTIVIGHSIGSGTATQMAVEFAPAALILIAPFTALADVAGEAMPIVPVRALLKDRYDNIAKLPGLKLPILIQHGTADDVIPHAHGQRLAKAAPQATFQSFEGEDHVLSFEVAAQVAQSEWLDSLGL